MGSYGCFGMSMDRVEDSIYDTDMVYMLERCFIGYSLPACYYWVGLCGSDAIEFLRIYIKSAKCCFDKLFKPPSRISPQRSLGGSIFLDH